MHRRSIIPWHIRYLPTRNSWFHPPLPLRISFRLYRPGMARCEQAMISCHHDDTSCTVQDEIFGDVRGERGGGAGRPRGLKSRNQPKGLPRPGSFLPTITYKTHSLLSTIYTSQNLNRLQLPMVVTMVMQDDCAMIHYHIWPTETLPIGKINTKKIRNKKKGSPPSRASQTRGVLHSVLAPSPHQ